MNSKRKWVWRRNSLTVKSLVLIMVVNLAILLFMQITSFYYMNIYKTRTIDNYKDSLNMYCSYWDNKLHIINSSMIALTSTKNIESPYWGISNATKELEFETSKIMLMRQMSDIARNHDNDIMLFYYYPESNVFLKSTNNIVEFNKREILNLDIQKYIENITKYNSQKWSLFMSDNTEMFINVYQVSGGYIGAIVKFDTVFNEVLNDNDVVLNAALHDEEKNFTHYIKLEDKVKAKDSIIHSIDMENLFGDLQITILQSSLLNDKMSFIILSLATILLGLGLLTFNIRYQIRLVLNPLNLLKDAMESFSQGNLNVRLEDNNSSNEIKVLYQTFNNMAEQISNLKIQVYESRIEREKIQSNYMRVQIQPHFYANILNLIYGLAQIQDHSSIQRLVMNSGAYFRYLMGEKGTFVLLREEIECVSNYMEIQQMRYDGYLDFKIHVEEKLENQLVIPMILQTFAENAIKHNVTLVPMLVVRIKVTGKQGKIYISVEDNGIGFDKETLDKIKSNENISKDGDHIGIQNVMERLKIFYEDKASVKIDSSPGKTSIQVILPEIVTEEEKSEYFIS